jgi:hypothetical protein
MYDNNFADQPIDREVYENASIEHALEAADEWSKKTSDIINTVESITLYEVDYHYEEGDILHIKIPPDVKVQITIALLQKALIKDFSYNHTTGYLTVYV